MVRALVLLVLVVKVWCPWSLGCTVCWHQAAAKGRAAAEGKEEEKEVKEREGIKTAYAGRLAVWGEAGFWRTVFLP